MSDDDNNEDAKLSSQDVVQLKRCKDLIVQAKGILEDIDDGVREEYGDLEDALSKLGEAEDLIEETIPEDGEGGGPV